jgi:four helix bundle protein
MSVQSYRDLLVWQKAIEFVCDCYNVSQAFPKHETYGLCSQLRRAVISIPARIAEGHGRSQTRDYVYQLSLAHGTLMEAETQIIIAEKLQYINNTQSEPLLSKSSELGRMLHGLMNSLQRKLTDHA